eukprot:CAMPEP_0113639798 /NCGR_PEP_ID=MMETSP0017_2-20120614/20886_1 /TAXON_ID=2856 /ORGANISM="Cylindrotheca closterium" /LENGTH=480 /DNA_ID=CAMNT_0000551045 /DNA_START=84 /DNA_END=1526 /DNA_ORIENTATION=- /assembly_acc=CAM_ASM_000147
MKIQSSLLALAFTAIASAAETHLRSAQANPFQKLEELEQYSCTIEGAGGQDQCDAAKDESGATCVWCSVGSFGACLSADQAALIEDKIPGLTCDDDSNDDKTADDDAKTDDTAADDDASPDDDSTYWKCLKDGSESEDACESAGCTWCTSKAGFGICLDEAAAKMASDSAWLDCKMMATLDLMDLQAIQQEKKKKQEAAQQKVQMPGDPACIMATLQQDESVCTSTVDSSGNPCSWCNIDNVNVCLDDTLATMAEQYGGSCGGDVVQVEDPADTTCIVATLQQDETACTATSDADGRACEWCQVAQAQVCLNADQAQMAEQFGGSCGDDSQEEVQDAADTTCLMATLQQDETACTSTTDAEGEACSWCAVGNFDLCLNFDQATLAEEFAGGACDQNRSSAAAEKEEKVKDPADTTCIVASLQQDESACTATMDADGRACEWCEVAQAQVCLNADQAQMAEQFGGSCGDDSSSSSSEITMD